MPPKRKRRGSPSSRGLNAGEVLKRSTLPGNSTTTWGWVGTEVLDVSQLTREHLLMACGLSARNTHPLCRNKFALKVERRDSSRAPTPKTPVDGELNDDVIVISDDEGPTCSKKACKTNPNCLNYLGQDLWEDEDDARTHFIKSVGLGEDPLLDTKDPDLPVGLRNLGATCYANASLQVWFRDLAFRSGVYNCQPTEGTDDKFMESPIFQLQVTFAALQESTQNVFNPTKLVESLQLRATEQQDAQEFSKLFMSHLDAEFKKQSIPSLRSLVTDQFQGKQVYGTRCAHCRYQSERESDFLEIEINFEKNSRLEDRIATLLQPETLTGDNKYLCSRCDSLRDATRYTELRSLPPVLHFSLLRFVYDVSTMERKKSKHAISFPMTLDMNGFLGNDATRKAATSSTTKKCDDNVYELRGVLLHKGASAYHGHYEAQVFDDVNQSWFQFNDEIVTKIKTLGDKQRVKRNTPVIDLEDDENKPAAQGKKQRANARKRQRVDDSDDEAANAPGGSEALPKRPSSSDISSKDAYMLVYARKNTHLRGSSLDGVMELNRVNDSSRHVAAPPRRALEAVQSLNLAHDGECEKYAEKEKVAKTHFDELRRKVMDIYRTWNITSLHDRDSMVVSQSALKQWLATNCMKKSVKQLNGVSTAGASPLPTACEELSRSDSTLSENPTPLQAQVSESKNSILCMHNLLDHNKAGLMKRISREAYLKISDETEGLSPAMSLDDVCEECVRMTYKEKFYQIDHPRAVSQFDQVADAGVDSVGYWVSKLWLRDWRLARPKMHVASTGDPGPDSPEYDSHVRCEHGGLSLNTTARRRISVEACEILTNIFTSWSPLSTDAEPCAVCDAMVSISKEDKLELRKRAEDEKAQLKHMHDFALGGDMSLLENVACAVVPAQFVRSWKQWVVRPTETSRPVTVDNTPFFCEHQLLVFDPNCPSDLNSSLALIKRADWDALEILYSSGPLIAIEKVNQENGVQAKFSHDIPVCPECRQKRKSEWESTEITIRICGKGDTLNDHDAPPEPAANPSRNSGARQSKRLRQVKQNGERRKMTIAKTMTLKDIKVQLQGDLKIPTICQRLFYRGEELADNSATIASLRILANDILDLREENEIHEISDSDDVPRKKRREEGRAFVGTLLGGTISTSSDPPEQMIVTVEPSEKSCGACTYSNPIDAVVCTMCDTVFV